MMNITFSPRGQIRISETGLTKRLQPKARWVQLDGPPGHGKSAVWEHPSGARIHALGTLRLADGRHFHDGQHYDKITLARVMQPGRRIRALMVWAELVLAEDQPASHSQSAHTATIAAPARACQR